MTGTWKWEGSVLVRQNTLRLGMTLDDEEAIENITRGEALDNDDEKAEYVDEFGNMHRDERDDEEIPDLGSPIMKPI